MYNNISLNIYVTLGKHVLVGGGKPRSRFNVKCQQWKSSHRFFNLLILASKLLGLVDPLTLVLRKRLQIQLQTTRIHAQQVQSIAKASALKLDGTA